MNITLRLFREIIIDVEKQ